MRRRPAVARAVPLPFPPCGSRPRLAAPSRCGCACSPRPSWSFFGQPTSYLDRRRRVPGTKFSHMNTTRHVQMYQDWYMGLKDPYIQILTPCVTQTSHVVYKNPYVWIDAKSPTCIRRRDKILMLKSNAVFFNPMQMALVEITPRSISLEYQLI